MTRRLRRQIDFIVEIDKLKRVRRQTFLMGGHRYENDAEHSWHIAVMAWLLWEYSSRKRINLLRVIEMLLVHDLVEIDAGDTFCYDDKAARTKTVRESRAAKRIFGILPRDQRDRLWLLWREFEDMRTPESRFAAAMDRLQPLIHNYHTKGRAWRKHKVAFEKVMVRNQHIGEGAPQLWRYAKKLLQRAVEKGYISRATRRTEAVDATRRPPSRSSVVPSRTRQGTNRSE